MSTRFVVLLAALLVALPGSAQDQFDDATRATAAACVEHLRPEQLPPCVLALHARSGSSKRSCGTAGRGSRRSRRR